MLDRSLTRADKVLSPSDFRSAYRAGRRIPSQSFTAFVVRNGFGRSRIGITATKKLGNAVERNKSKRLVREVFRHHKNQLSGGYDIILNVRRQILTVGSERLNSEFLDLICRINQQW